LAPSPRNHARQRTDITRICLHANDNNSIYLAAQIDLVKMAAQVKANW